MFNKLILKLLGITEVKLIGTKQVTYQRTTVYDIYEETHLDGVKTYKEKPKQTIIKENTFYN